jgi:hypothetical protein
LRPVEEREKEKKVELGSKLHKAGNMSFQALWAAGG